jgi:hypothetical protein
VLELPVKFSRDTNESRDYLTNRVSRNGAKARRGSGGSCPQMTQMFADQFNSFVFICVNLRHLRTEFFFHPLRLRAFA